MTFNIELEEEEIIQALYELWSVANDYMIDGKYYESSKCLLLANRIEVQYRAQQQCDNQESQEKPIE